MNLNLLMELISQSILWVLECLILLVFDTFNITEPHAVLLDGVSKDLNGIDVNLCISCCLPSEIFLNLGMSII